jgi:SNF2 family DNA or RNA helicase
VSVEADPAATTLLGRVNQESQQLETVLAAAPLLSAEEVKARLVGTRFKRELRSFQIRDLGRLLGIPHGANFSVPGAGKTTVTYALYEAERAAGNVDRLLVVAPLSAFDAWTSEPKECFSTPVVVWPYEAGKPIPAEAEVVIINYSRLVNQDNFGAVIDWLQQGRGHTILDEGHRIKKGRDGAWGTVCLDLSWYAVRRDVLSGTPAPQHPSDLEALVEFLWPGQARRVLPAGVFDVIPSPTIGHQIAAAMAPLQVRTRKSELDLEQPIRQVLEFEMSDLQREIYLAITNQYSGAIPLSTRDRTRLAEMRHIVMYLLEAATNPVLLALGASSDDPPSFQHPRSIIPAGSDLVALLNQYGTFETPPKFRKLGELVKANAELGRKTLVWSNFVYNLTMLKRMLGRYAPAIIHGGVPSVVSQPGAAVTREMELKRFREDPDCMVLLANPAAMSEGVSLHKDCHDAIYLERTFNAGQFLQSVDRIHRLGLEHGIDTRITFFVTKGTVDQLVYRRVEEKALRLGDMLNDPDIRTMALPDESDLQDVDSGFGQPLDDDLDVAALFAHLRGESAI